MKQIDFTELFSKRERVEVHVSMPEFKCGWESDLKKFCKELGVKTLFSPDADFSPFCKIKTEIGDIIHKACIEVDRDGTRAAAVTYCGRKTCAPVEKRRIRPIRLDRPFVYAIVHNDTGLPIFVGTVKHIEKISSEKRKNKETIWDYKPTEEEIKKICEQLDLTEKTIITESRDNDEYRLACLCKLFLKEKNIGKEIEL